MFPGQSRSSDVNWDPRRGRGTLPSLSIRVYLIFFVGFKSLGPNSKTLGCQVYRTYSTKTFDVFKLAFKTLEFNKLVHYILKKK